MYLGSAGSATVIFEGTYFAWVAKKSPVYGKAGVTLDGNTPQMVDLYSSSTQYRQVVWNTGTLSSGTHQVKIEWTGTRNPSATGSYVSVDAFDIVGLLPARHDQTHSRFAYSGNWAPFSTSSAYGGSYARANSYGASVTITFTSSYLAWVATKGTTLGKALVSVDGDAATSVNLAASTVAYRQKVWNTGILPYGTHTVKIWRDPNNLAGKYISIDAVDVIGAVQ
jgi:hypothetical protein